MVGQAERDRIAPRTFDRFRPAHEDIVHRLRLDRNVEQEASTILVKTGRPDRPDIACQRRVQRAPVHQIPRMPDGEAGIGVEGRKGDVVILAILQDRRIGSIARDERIDERPVALVGDPLVVEPAPVGARPGGPANRLKN